MTTPLEAVFTTPELLESILLHLPQRTLLLSQRVNRTFHSLITSSPSIQRALFFLPELERPNQSTTWRQNPLLCHTFPPFFQLQPLDRRRYFEQFTSQVFENIEFAKNEETRKAYARRQASWRRMLVVQPTVEVLVIRSLCHGPAGDSERMGSLVLPDSRLRSQDRETSATSWASDQASTIASPYRCLKKEGLTMGLLYDLIERAVMVVGNSFWVKWHMFPDAGLDDYKTLVNGGLKPSIYTSTSENDEGFQPRPEATLFLSRTISCKRRRMGSRPRLESEAAEMIDIVFTKWETCMK